MMTKNIINTIFLSAIILLNNGCIKHKQADLVLHNAKVYTLNSLNETFEAVAIKDGKILEVGKNREILNKYRYENSFDAKKATVYPGFIDAHCHFIGYGLSSLELNLRNVNSFDEMVNKVKEYATNNPDGWITGRGWDQTKWATSTYPHKSIFDSLFPNRPLLLRRVDGHAAIANQKALTLASINQNTNIRGGLILKDENGLTGILVDNAVDSVRAVIPEPTTSQYTKAILLAQDSCLKYGLTTVGDAGISSKEVKIIQELQRSGQLKLRVYAMLSDNKENKLFAKENGIIKSEKLNVRSFKLYGDGALGSRGACLKSPYSDVDSSHYGMMLFDSLHYLKMAQFADSINYQLCTHCIGDSANRFILKIYGKVLEGTNDKRWRIEHAQVIDSIDFELFQKFNVIPSVQPTHATSDMAWVEKRLGNNRSKFAYNYELLRQQNGMIAFGTDFPVEKISPIHTYYAATVRKNDHGLPNDGFQLHGGVTRMDALKAMTIWAAISNFEENEKGSIEIGKNADFTIVDRDLITVDEKLIPDAKITATIIGGEIVYTK